MKWISVETGMEPWLAGAVLLTAIGFLWLLLRLVVRRGGRRRDQPCRWKRSKTKGSQNLRAWTCATCGVLAYSATWRAPVDCKRDLRARPL